MGLFDRFRRKPNSEPTLSTRAAAPFDALHAVRRYHQVTKHHPMRYARGPQGLDWETQPDPFRRYAGATLIRLPLEQPKANGSFDEIVIEKSEPGQPLCAATLSGFLRFALGLSAWKQFGDSRWALRMNPSSGNLHPTEGYVLCGPTEGLGEEGLLAHYAPKEHGLEVRSTLTPAQWETISADFSPSTFFVGLSSIYWREEWKYGERAYRYCNHDVGHAIAALHYSAACLGWKVRMLDQLSTEQVGAVLGLGDFGDAEPEEGDTLLAISPGDVTTSPQLTAQALDILGSLARHGEANELSSDHQEWDAIYTCAFASEKPPTPSCTPYLGAAPTALQQRGIDAHSLLAQRRSAQTMDGKTSISRSDFMRCMQRCLPLRDQVPFTSMPWSPRVHLILFVHRVDGLAPGLYALLRETDSGQRLRDQMHDDFLWEPVGNEPEGLPLFLLKAGSYKSSAAGLSCDQAIAGDSAFSLGMLAEFDESLNEQGPWIYPRLFWETGLIGQALYLESEAAGLRGTGIGCFHDDPVHQQLGLEGSAFQSLYHFTIGGALEDTRLQNLPAYEGLK
jgi:SagB-type dehydrogenase family enzyme